MTAATAAAATVTLRLGYRHSAITDKPRSSSGDWLDILSWAQVRLPSESIKMPDPARAGDVRRRGGCVRITVTAITGCP